MQKNTINPLAWDSQFFGYPIAQIILDQEGMERLDHLFEQLAARGFRLAYFFVPPAEKEINERIKKGGGGLVDQKTVFLKATEKHDGITNPISDLQGSKMNERLKELALQAGLFSRFRTDKNFVKNEYERLYIEWLSKSVNGEISFKTLVALRDSDIMGITTLDDVKKYAHIGLVAVDKACRGQGLGRDLIHTADTAAFDRGLKEIKVVTQLQNKSACRLYEKCGFHVESITNVYHYWL